MSNKDISYDLIFKSTNTFTYHKTNCSQFFKKKATRDIVIVSLTGWVMDTLLSFVAFIV